MADIEPTGSQSIIDPPEEPTWNTAILATAACGYYGVGAFPYSTSARGVLTGKYKPNGKPLVNSRAGLGDASVLSRDTRNETLQMVDKIKKDVAKRGITPSDFAVRWVLNNQIVTGVVAGPNTLGQWKGYLGARKHNFTAEDEALCDSLVARRAIRRHQAPHCPATPCAGASHVECDPHHG